MRHLFIGACLAVLAGPAIADHSNHPETRSAQQLSQTLDQLASEARNAEYEARRNGDLAAVRDLSDIRNSAEVLSNGVETRILWVLYGRDNRSDIAIAQRELSNLRWQFERLYRTVQISRYLPWSLTRLVENVRRLQSQLEFDLNNCRDGGGGGNGRGNWECVAQDNGWEEHRGGHLGGGRDRRSAEYQATSQCERLHGSCRIVSCVQQRF